jgi:hypothetical protein
MFKGWAILPAAQCLFGKTKVSIDEIAKEWSNGTIVVMKKPNGQLHFIAGSSGSYGEIGSFHECYHDQTGGQFGRWQIVNAITYSTKDGVVSFKYAVEPLVQGVNFALKAGMAVFK